MQLDNDDLNEDLVQIFETAELDETQESRIERDLPIQYRVVTREERLEAIAKDIVSHFMGRGYRGKAMVISIDKATAVKMYDKVQKHWESYVEELQGRLRGTTADGEGQALQDRIRYMKETDMAVVVSQSQNEIGDLRAQGVDITPHRQRMNTEDLDAKFKDPENPFRIVFVCAMWMTGFDVPACSTIYLDKPQRNHTLMQTIARANRVFADKANGLIVDYIGIFRNLEQALAIYAEGTDEEGRNPIQDKSELVEKLKGAIAEIKQFCANHGVDLAQIDAADPGTLEPIRQISDAVDRILVNDQTKQDYLQGARNVFKLYRAILPDAAANDFRRICTLIHIIAQNIKNSIAPADTSDVMEEIEDLLDRSIVPTGYTIDEDSEIHDLSQIDFDQLRERYRTQHKHIEAQRLRGAIDRQLSEMVRLNRTRMNYQERFEQIIAEYNAARDVDVWFEQLIAFTEELNEEEQRTIAEQLTEEQLAVFDLLTRPALELTEAERDKVKAISKQLLETLKEGKLVLDWRKRQQSRAAVKLTVLQNLRELRECYTQEMYDQKREAVYQHIYESYHGDGNSIYGAAA